MQKSGKCRGAFVADWAKDVAEAWAEDIASDDKSSTIICMIAGLVTFLIGASFFSSGLVLPLFL